MSNNSPRRKLDELHHLPSALGSEITAIMASGREVDQRFATIDLPASSLPHSPTDDAEIIELQRQLDDSSAQAEKLELLIEQNLAHLAGLIDGTIEPAS